MKEMDYTVFNMNKVYGQRWINVCKEYTISNGITLYSSIERAKKDINKKFKRKDLKGCYDDVCGGLVELDVSNSIYELVLKNNVKLREHEMKNLIIFEDIKLK